MTAPREILPGRTYLITRRCTQRQYLLRPDLRTRLIFDYCLAEAAARHEIELIAWVAMSNHYHAVVHDPKGRLPAFLEHFHKMLARSLNVRWCRWENFWSTEQTCVTYLPTPQDVFDKVLYVLSNPMAAHLVDRLVHWPGSSSLQHLDGRETTQERPTSFFNADGCMPARVPLRAVQPPCTRSSETFEAWTARVRDALSRTEHELDGVRARSKVRIVGRKAVLRVAPSESPATATPRRNLRPAIACKDDANRLRVLAQLVTFRTEYRNARLRFEQGAHDVVFPAGTYRLRAWGARCAPFPIAA